MNTIIISTDFSENSHKAALYALQLFGGQNRKFLLVHAYQAVKTSGMLISLHDLLKKESENSLEIEKDRLRNAGFSREDIESVAWEGTVKNVLSRIAEKEEAYLIVMGTRGASGLKEKLIGSNTYDVIQKSETPVLAIPEDTEIGGPSKAMIALENSGLQDLGHLQPIKEILSYAKAKAIVLSVENEEELGGNWKELMQNRVGDYFNGISPSFQFLENSQNLPEALGEFIVENEIDLVAVFPKRHSFFSRLFQKSVTKRMVMHSKVPLIAIHD